MSLTVFTVDAVFTVDVYSVVYFVPQCVVSKLKHCVKMFIFDRVDRVSPDEGDN